MSLPKLFTAVALMWCAAPATAQEINCTVNLNTDQLFAQQKTDFGYFNQLKNVITEFMNARRWTNDQFAPAERINCTLNINLLKSLSQGVFDGTAQLIVSRPVYGSTYETPTLSYVDSKFNFAWLPTSPVYFRDNAYTDELTSLLAFYANIVLATDYDSFSKQGGTPYVQRAYQIMNLAQPNGGAGWSAGGDIRHRYWLVENLQSQQLLSFRDGFYAYHRQSLDNFAANPIQARKQVLGLLTTIRQITQQRPGAVLLNAFFDAKSDELLNIMFEGTPDERKKAFDLLSFLDPTKTEAYRKLVQ